MFSPVTSSATRSAKRALLMSSWLCLVSALSQEPPGGVTPVTAGPVSVNELVQQVQVDNLELDFYRAEIAAARAGRKSAVRWENPEISAELGSKKVWDRHGSTLGDGPAWSVALAQPFEWPGRLALRKAIANQQIEIAELGLQQFQTALAVRARSLGHAVLVARQKADAAQEVAARYRALLEVVVQREVAGFTPLLEQRILESGTITLGRRATGAEREVQAALLELNQLRGQPAHTPIHLTGQLVVPTDLPILSHLLAIAITNNFEIRMKRVELAQQGFQVRLTRNERYPRVTVAPYYSEERASDEERIVGLGLSFPLPLWNRNQGNIEVATAREQQAEASLRVIVREVERAVTDHALALESKLAEMARWRPEAQRQLREAAELADRHYRLGAVPVTTYLEMQNQYLEALEALLATRREALDHRQQLELLVGQPLETLSAR
jgi:cobalt-zinc-cadmium efflux system outer membrane protein